MLFSTASKSRLAFTSSRLFPIAKTFTAKATTDSHAAVVVMMSIAACSVTSITLFGFVAAERTSENDKKKRNYENVAKPPSYRIPVDFMDRLATKPYLNFQKQEFGNGSNSYNDDDGERCRQNRLRRRPAAVPMTLRLLTVDLPEVALFGIAGGGGCRQLTDRVYPDGIAPSKQTRVALQQKHLQQNGNKQDDQETPSNNAHNDGHDQPEELVVDVEQKAWVRAMFQCTVNNDNRKNNNDSSRCADHVGVEILHANCSALNPSNLRRMVRFGSMRYDPAKYSTARQGSSRRVYASSKKTRNNQKQTPPTEAEIATSSSSSSVQASGLDELEAPWHQHAWAEELELRLSGQVPFGATMESIEVKRDTFYRRFLKSWFPFFYPLPYKYYRPALFSSYRNSGFDDRFESADATPVEDSNALLLKLIFPWRWLSFWQSQKRTKENHLLSTADDNKPHAVIANGAILHRVPGAARLLQKTCKDNHVPLFVIRDPRVWGANTHDGSSPEELGSNDMDEDLGAALRDVQQQIKAQIIQTSLKQLATPVEATVAWKAGRLAGKLASSSWYNKEAKKLAQERAQEAFAGRQDMDWSHLSDKELEEKLVQRGVIHRKRETADVDNGHQTSPTFDKMNNCTDAMIALARRCVGNSFVRGLDDENSKE